MEYLGEIIWYSIWPILIYISVKFTQHNIKHYEKLERLEAYEKKYGKDINIEEDN